eukprot:Seg664.6 transcript_id=Seg664.6/GoldUCD/mRNA.D3Y31 product="hypothetical protein" protein_id=Seg664.6/GoldUCD/D3Y31
MRNLNKVIQTAHIEGKSWQQEIFNFVRNYRASPHATTGFPPAKLLMGRNIRTKLPEHTDTQVNKDLKDRDKMKKRKMKEYADRKNHASESDLKEGDKVIVKQRQRNKAMSPYDLNGYCK